MLSVFFAHCTVYLRCSSFDCAEQLFMKNRAYFCEGLLPYGCSDHNSRVEGQLWFTEL